MSMGSYDIDQFSSLDPNQPTASLARHCTSVRVVADFIVRSYLSSDASGNLANRLLLWGTPYSEPYINPLNGKSAMERYPWNWLEEANRCTVHAGEEGALNYLNTSSLLKPPPYVMEALSTQTGGTEPGQDGRLLTLDGYLPSFKVRKVLLEELMGSIAALARWRRSISPSREMQGGNEYTLNYMVGLFLCLLSLYFCFRSPNLKYVRLPVGLGEHPNKH